MITILAQSPVPANSITKGMIAGGGKVASMSINGSSTTPMTGSKQTDAGAGMFVSPQGSFAQIP